MSDAWRPIQLSRQLVLEGGYQTKTHRLETKDVTTPHGELTFVKVDKRQDWLVKAAAGKAARPGCLSRTTVVDAVKKALVAAVAARSADEPSPSNANANAQGQDPMDALDDLGG